MSRPSESDVAPGSELPGALVRAGEGEVITDLDRREAMLVAAHEQITITRYRLAPGEHGPPPHVHREHTDAFYVLEGELGFVLGPRRERFSLGAGGLLAAPPNLVHTFANESGREVRFLNLHTPDGGFAAFMRGRRDGDEGASFDTCDPPPDGGLPLREALIAPPGEGERLVSRNRVALLKAAPPHLCFAEFELDGPFDGPDPHRHEVEVDSFYVLEGELEITVEDGVYAAGPGTLVSIPPGTQHAFTHRGSGRVRFLNVHAPDAGFGEFLRRVSE